nr:polysaccharide deacetylase family protein [Microbacterium bovistercoris]
MQIRFGLGIRAKLAAAARVGGDGVAAGRMFVERHALATTRTAPRRTSGRVLCYHSLAQPAWGVNDVAPARFRQQLELALEAGYRFVPAAELARTGGGPRDLSITFDDGARSVLTTAAPILASYGIPYSLFVVSAWSEDGHRGMALSWDEICSLADQGAEIGNHSSTHPDFSTLSKDQALEEIGGASELIESRTGIRTTTFAIPLGQSANWTDDADDAARELGYDVIYAQAEETRRSGTVARTFVTRYDSPRIFSALLRGRYDRWEEWVSPTANW